MKRKTANWRSKEGRLTSMLVNWFRNAEKICPMMLSSCNAIVVAASPCMNPLMNSLKLKLWKLTYMLKVCFTIVGTR